MHGFKTEEGDAHCKRMGGEEKPIKNSRQGHIRGLFDLSLNHTDPIDEKKLAFETKAMVSPIDPPHHQLHRNLANFL